MLFEERKICSLKSNKIQKAQVVLNFRYSKFYCFVDLRLQYNKKFKKINMNIALTCSSQNFGYYSEIQYLKILVNLTISPLPSDGHHHTSILNFPLQHKDDP